MPISPILSPLGFGRTFDPLWGAASAVSDTVCDTVSDAKTALLGRPRQRRRSSFVTDGLDQLLRDASASLGVTSPRLSEVPSTPELMHTLFGGSSMFASAMQTSAVATSEAHPIPEVQRRRRTSSVISEGFDFFLREASASLGMSSSSQSTDATNILSELNLSVSEMDLSVSTGLSSVPCPLPSISDSDISISESVQFNEEKYPKSPSPSQIMATQNFASPQRKSAESWRPLSPSLSPVLPSRTGSNSPSSRQRLKGASTDPKHAAIRKHVCKLCSGRFLCKSKLDRHMLTHTGARPFACYCGKRFNQKSALKNHSRRHLKKGDTPPELDVLKGINGFTYAALMQQPGRMNSL